MDHVMYSDENVDQQNPTDLFSFQGNSKCAMKIDATLQPKENSLPNL